MADVMCLCGQWQTVVSDTICPHQHIPLHFINTGVFPLCAQLG